MMLHRSILLRCILALARVKLRHYAAFIPIEILHATGGTNAVHPLEWPPCELPPADNALFAAKLENPHRKIFCDLATDGYAVIDSNGDGWIETCDAVRAAIGVNMEGKGRLQDAWRHHDPVRQLATWPFILDMLRAVYGREPIPFQTLNFARGTEQGTHSDTWHFHCNPQRWLCGIWVALEDIDDLNGALHVVPGSHRLPIISPEDLSPPPDGNWENQYQRSVHATVAGYGLQRKTVPLRRGQAILWAANLLHGGEPIRDATRSRWSQVTHYYFADCAYYLPCRSDILGGDIRLRRVIDIRSGKYVSHRHRGRILPLTADQAFWERPSLRHFIRVVAERTISTLQQRIRGSR